MRSQAEISDRAFGLDAVQTGKFRTPRLRVPVPLLALLAGLAVLFGLGINVGELFVGRTAPAIHDHGPHVGDNNDHGKGPGGLSVASQGYVLRPRTTRFTAGEYQNFRFNVFASTGQPVTDFARRGDRRMDLIIIRRDMSVYQHLYPVMDPDGTWTAPLELDEPGSYRAFADFVPGSTGKPVTLGVDIDAPGLVEPGPISKVSTVAEIDGYTVIWTGELIAGSVSRVWMHVMRDDVPVTDLDPVLGAGGHLVILREGDLAYLNVHPVAGPRQDTAIDFDVDVPSAGYYRMFFEFQHHGQLRTVEFTGLARQP